MNPSWHDRMRVPRVVTPRGKLSGYGLLACGVTAVLLALYVWLRLDFLAWLLLAAGVWILVDLVVTSLGRP